MWLWPAKTPILPKFVLWWYQGRGLACMGMLPSTQPCDTCLLDPSIPCFQTGPVSSNP